MLHEFLISNRAEILSRCRFRARARRAPQAANGDFEWGIPAFLTQLMQVLRKESAGPEASESRIAAGQMRCRCSEELSLDEFNVGKFVHDYGDVFQTVTELAIEQDEPISNHEFRIFNRCLNGAVADALSAFLRKRERLLANASERLLSERLGFLAHEFRNLTNTSILALEGMRRTGGTVTGPTAEILDRSLNSMRDLCARALIEVRQHAAVPATRERVPVAEFMREVQSSAVPEAEVRGLDLVVADVEQGLMINIDRQILARVIANLLQNAFKFSKPGSQVHLRAFSSADRVLIEVEDECGGLPDGDSEDLFRLFEQQGSDRSGVGLGLAISRVGVELNGGTIHARNLPGRGCVFTIDLAEATDRPSGKTPRRNQHTAFA